MYVCSQCVYVFPLFQVARHVLQSGQYVSGEPLAHIIFRNAYVLREPVYALFSADGSLCAAGPIGTTQAEHRRAVQQSIAPGQGTGKGGQEDLYWLLGISVPKIRKGNIHTRTILLPVW